MIFLVYMTYFINLERNSYSISILLFNKFKINKFRLKKEILFFIDLNNKKKDEYKINFYPSSIDDY